jgi:hypothetical protein
LRLVYGDGSRTTRSEPTPELDRKRFAAIRTALVIADEEREMVKQHASAA